MIKDNSNILLTEVEISFFLKKVDAAKLGDRISKHYNISSIEEFKKFLELPQEAKLSELLLIKTYKEKDIPNKILNNNEKIELKKMYLKEIKAKLEKRKKKDNSEKEQKIKMIAELMVSSEKLIEILRNLSEITIKQRNQVLKKIEAIRIELKNKENLDFEDVNYLESYQRMLSIILNKPTYTNLNEKQRIMKQRELSLEYLNRMNKIKSFQEKELIDRINKRKNENLEQTQKDNDEIKNELVIIEAYTEDF